MTLRSSLAVFGVGTAFAWAAFLLIFVTVPPETADSLGEFFFFSALFLALTGTLTMLGIVGRWRMSSVLPALHIGPAFRQGMLLSGTAAGLLLLQRFRFLRWWNVLLVVAVAVLLDVLLTRGRDAVPE
ncbi:MAG: Uncharacterized protein G01um101438_266 [Parcubacteria group bacterium Gr01-1014_38]|nr:MAG: Uncharacterized protein G01um101438_266 [Parcubacteria group bacterium Gr01-1014_38]